MSSQIVLGEAKDLRLSVGEPVVLELVLGMTSYAYPRRCGAALLVVLGSATDPAFGPHKAEYYLVLPPLC